MQSNVIRCFIRYITIPAFTFEQMVVAAPGVTDHIYATVERDGRDEQILRHQFVDGAPSHSIEATMRLIIVREVAVWVECKKLTIALQHDFLFSLVLGKAVSVGHGRDHEFTRAKKVRQIRISAIVRCKELD